jgi:hypothetical protein
MNATNVTDLFARYLALIRDAARHSSAANAADAELHRIFRLLDDDCAALSDADRRHVRRVLSAQIEQEALRYGDPYKRRVYDAVLKHLEAAE